MLQTLGVRLTEYGKDTAELGDRKMALANPFQFSAPHGCEAQHYAGVAHRLFEHGRTGGRQEMTRAVEVPMGALP